MLLALTAALGFAPAPISPLSRSAVRAGRPLMATPLDAVASPLNKWAPAAAAGGSPLDGLPLEVQALFAIIPIVGVLGLLKSNGMLGDNAPTLGLGDSREDLAPEAVVPQLGFGFGFGFGLGFGVPSSMKVASAAASASRVRVRVIRVRVRVIAERISRRKRRWCKRAQKSA